MSDALFKCQCAYFLCANTNLVTHHINVKRDQHLAFLFIVRHFRLIFLNSPTTIRRLVWIMSRFLLTNQLLRASLEEQPNDFFLSGMTKWQKDTCLL